MSDCVLKTRATSRRWSSKAFKRAWIAASVIINSAVSTLLCSLSYSLHSEVTPEHRLMDGFSVSALLSGQIQRAFFSFCSQVRVSHSGNCIQQHRKDLQRIAGDLQPHVGRDRSQGKRHLRWFGTVLEQRLGHAGYS